MSTENSLPWGVERRTSEHARGITGRKITHAIIARLPSHIAPQRPDRRSPFSPAALPNPCFPRPGSDPSASSRSIPREVHPICVDLIPSLLTPSSPAAVPSRHAYVIVSWKGRRGAARVQRLQHAVGAAGAGEGDGGCRRRGGGRPGGCHGVLRRQRHVAAGLEAGAPARAARRVPEQPPRHLRLLQGSAWIDAAALWLL
uniref:Uncharacterized protein n=1 Tax=Oryza glumipatula TaxID=40148 RepID=A0A0D9ZI84_9ORYZ